MPGFGWGAPSSRRLACGAAEVEGPAPMGTLLYTIIVQYFGGGVGWQVYGRCGRVSMGVLFSMRILQYFFYRVLFFCNIRIERYAPRRLSPSLRAPAFIVK